MLVVDLVIDRHEETSKLAICVKFGRRYEWDLSHQLGRQGASYSAAV